MVRTFLSVSFNRKLTEHILVMTRVPRAHGKAVLQLVESTLKATPSCKDHPMPHRSHSGSSSPHRPPKKQRQHKPTVHGHSLLLASWENVCTLRAQCWLTPAQGPEAGGVLGSLLHTAAPAGEFFKTQATEGPQGSPCSRARLSPPLSASGTSSPADVGLTALSWRRCCFLSSRSFKIIFKMEQIIKTPKYVYLQTSSSAE